MSEAYTVFSSVGLPEVGEDVASGFPVSHRGWSGLEEGVGAGCGPHPRATQLSLSWIPPRPCQGGATRSHDRGGQESRGVDLLWGGGPVRFMGKWGKLSQPPNHTAQSLTPPRICLDFYTPAQAADSLAGHELQGAGYRAIASPQSDIYGGEWSAQWRRCPWCGRMIQLPVSWLLLLQLSPQSHKPQPLFTQL